MPNPSTTAAITNATVQVAHQKWAEALIKYGAGLIGRAEYYSIRRTAYAIIRAAEDQADEEVSS